MKHVKFWSSWFPENRTRSDRRRFFGSWFDNGNKLSDKIFSWIIIGGILLFVVVCAFMLIV